VDETEGDGVGTNTERTPLLGKSLCEANDRSLGSSIVGLPNVSVKTRGRGNIDNGTVFRVTLIQYERHNEWVGVRWHMYLDTHVWCSGADQPEWSTNVDLLDDVPSIIWKSVKHLVKRKTSYKRPSTTSNRLEGYCYEPLLTMWLSFPYFEIVASIIFFGKSSAPTSPPTAIASPPNPCISSTTS